jgi:hypothetical protein
MQNILSALAKAFGLIISLDREVFSIVLLSFSISLTAVFFSSLISLPLSLLLALKKFPGNSLSSHQPAGTLRGSGATLYTLGYDYCPSYSGYPDYHQPFPSNIEKSQFYG